MRDAQNPNGAAAKRRGIMFTVHVTAVCLRLKANLPVYLDAQIFYRSKRRAFI